jgi:uncharacterized protein YcbX
MGSSAARADEVGARTPSACLSVAELWRYPVKSFAGERLDVAAVTPAGLRGDRVVHVQDGRGRVVTARTHPGLLAFRAALGADGEPLVDGRPWTAPAVTEAVRRVVGPLARLVRDDSLDRFDVLPLTVLTDGSIAALGVDRRRLRPNILIEGAPGLAERTWPGRRLRIGDVVIGVRKLRGRCVMTTYDPDTREQDPGVLRRIVEEFGGRMALDCWVISPGRIAAGDPVELID